MVDGGGGNGVLRQLASAGIDWRNMQHIFVTHKHIDHLLGVIWMMRVIAQGMSQGTYEGDAYVYAHTDLAQLLDQLTNQLLNAKQHAFVGKRLHLVPLQDGQTLQVMGCAVQAFDIQSTKAKQFGFTLEYAPGKKLTCCGDEPCSEAGRAYARGSDWLLHEAFCLYGERDHFHPYEKHHSTVRDACQLAEDLGVRNLVLYHTEDKNLANRKRLYTAEGKQYFAGNLFVPDDLERIEIS
jgi:ribonuclease Z